MCWLLVRQSLVSHFYVRINSVHLNDLKAVGVVGVIVGIIVGIVVGIVVAYHKYSRID